ncbi:50S ribosomal protein L9 [Blochmannia endosymbiont of Camponotus sp. C-003]|uniref:50S ribosomal protein L9 n=1 Tax=unclassified Candidatus Blochmanniella TaxID=711328 RepID=UPI0020247647|nr:MULTISPECIES: 50S ribosomal protein L9 [unclassified Candidatus Blochmannia]URJ23147.1 50S ribosomal protein L9 [Blochmannia endosymbiont of Camponotus sp. C-003]URJ28616.1 50S ribosomal protein L9 [Blochmannia endosymbiont of Camponotus sp. C-046]
MKIILLSNIDKLGSIGSEVIVRSGYARNFLIPKSKAIPSTKKNIEIFKAQQLELQSKTIAAQTQAEFCAETINKLGSITIKAKSGVEGKLFGSIGSRDIATAITAASGFNISKSQIRLPNHDVLKTIGTYNINIHIYNDIFAKINVIILG